MNHQKSSKLHRKVFQRLVWSKKYELKNRINNTTNEYRGFLESYFVGAHILFALVYSNLEGDFKTFKTPKYYLPKSTKKFYRHHQWRKSLLPSK